MKNHNKGFVVQGIIALVALIIIGGVAYVVTQKKDSVSQDITIDSISNWKTYTNKKYNFTFNYPSTWKHILDVENEVNIYVDAYPAQDRDSLIAIKGMGLEEVKKNDDLFRDKTFSKVTINGIIWEKTQMTDNSGAVMDSFEFLTERNGMTYEVGGPAEVTTTILSTFKFTSSSGAPVSNINEKITVAGKEVLTALKNKDYNKLETLASKDGISFKLAGYPLDLTKNNVLKEKISEISSDTNKYLWGYTDGKGDEIRLTTAEFIKQWIYSTNYLNAPTIVVNKLSNETSSYGEIIKNSEGRNFIGFHFNSSKEYPGMDYSTIYLIFDEENGVYKLRAVVKDNWTI